MFKKYLILTCCFTLLLASGCMEGEHQGYGPFKGQHFNEGGGPNHGVLQGDGGKSYYRHQSENEQGIDNPLPFFEGTRDYESQRYNPQAGTSRHHKPYGFIQHNANDADVIYEGYGAQTFIDREMLADVISQVVVGMPKVDQASVLVTDEDCIISYEGNADEEDLAEQVELSGLSVTPRWYKVYATDDENVAETLRNLAQNHSGDHYDVQTFNDEVDRIIQHLGGPKESWEQPGTGGEARYPHMGNEGEGANDQGQERIEAD